VTVGEKNWRQNTTAVLNGETSPWCQKKPGASACRGVSTGAEKEIPKKYTVTRMGGEGRAKSCQVRMGRERGVEHPYEKGRPRLRVAVLGKKKGKGANGARRFKNPGLNGPRAGQRKVRKEKKKGATVVGAGRRAPEDAVS